MSRGPTSALLPSTNFLLLCLVFSGTGAALWHGMVGGRVALLAFVISGWIVSLCLHEFGHALVAYRGGDASIPATGYLTLDPLRYADPFLSILFPLLFILIGGFGLPGGAVWIDHRNIRGPVWDAAVSAAGPLANGLFLLLLAGLYALLPHGEETTDIEAAVAALAFFQATAIVLNLLPIPGLDGFGILRPFLPGRVQAASNAVAGLVGFALVFLVLNVPVAAQFVFGAGRALTARTGIDPHDVYVGIKALRIF